MSVKGSEPRVRRKVCALCPFSSPFLHPFCALSAPLYRMVFFSTALGVLSFVVAVNAQTYSATYLPSNAPPTTEEGQTGTNQCGTAANQTSNCQNVYGMQLNFCLSSNLTCRLGIVNSVDDFCIWYVRFLTLRRFKLKSRSQGAS